MDHPPGTRMARLSVGLASAPDRWRTGVGSPDLPMTRSPDVVILALRNRRPPMLVSALRPFMQLKYLTENDWALLRSISRRRTFKAREIIIAINSQPQALFLLAGGSAAVEVMRGEPIAKLKAGDICGEMAFLEHAAASASVVAETDTEVDVLDLSEVERIFALYPHMQARFYRSLALLLSQRLRSTSARLARTSPQL